MYILYQTPTVADFLLLLAFLLSSFAFIHINLRASTLSLPPPNTLPVPTTYTDTLKQVVSNRKYLFFLKIKTRKYLSEYLSRMLVLLQHASPIFQKQF